MIFLDRSIPRPVASALKAVRDDVLWLEDVFPSETPDVEWLRAAGSNDWLVVTRDKKVRTRPGERRILTESGVGCFILNQKQDLTRWQYLRLLVSTIDEMERIFATTSRPFIFTIDSAGRFRRVV
jgi:hypothetical protein